MYRFRNSLFYYGCYYLFYSVYSYIKISILKVLKVSCKLSEEVLAVRVAREVLQTLLHEDVAALQIPGLL